MTLLSKPFVGIFFLLLSAIPVLLTGKILIARYNASEEMKHKLQQESLLTFSFAKEKIQWIKEGREILIEGKLFDVAYLRENNGFIELIGLFDAEEDELNEKYSNLLNEEEENSTALLLLKVFFTPFIEPGSYSSICNLSAIVSPLFMLFEENTTTRYYPVFTPPPKVGISA